MVKTPKTPKDYSNFLSVSQNLYSGCRCWVKKSNAIQLKTDNRVRWSGYNECKKQLKQPSPPLAPNY